MLYSELLVKIMLCSKLLVKIMLCSKLPCMKEHRAGVGVDGGLVVEEKRGVVGAVALENRVQRPLRDLEPEHAHTLLTEGRSGFGVQGAGFRVQGSGFRVQSSGFRVQGSGFRVPVS